MRWIIGLLTGWSGEQGKRFFFEKEEQKTFTCWSVNRRWWQCWASVLAHGDGPIRFMNKSFLVLL
jgi:hypothetical protein